MIIKAAALVCAVVLVIAGAAQANALHYAGSGGQGDWRTGITISDEVAARRADWSLIQIDN